MIPDLVSGLPIAGDLLQRRLSDIMQAQAAAFEMVVNEISGEADNSDLAAFIAAAWHGTLLRMKAESRPEPIYRFRRTLQNIVEL